MVFSKDGDILNYSSKHLKIIKDFNIWLNDKIKEVESEYHQKRLDEIEYFIKNKFEGIRKAVIDWVKDQLNHYSNYYEVHDLQIIEVDANIEGYNITHVSEDHISVDVKNHINYKVEIIIDDEEYMYKDYDTKEWVFMDTKPLFIDEIRHVDVEVGFEFESDGSTTYHAEIESINGGRELNV